MGPLRDVTSAVTVLQASSTLHIHIVTRSEGKEHMIMTLLYAFYVRNNLTCNKSARGCAASNIGAHV